MIMKEFKLEGKTIIPMRLRTHVGKPTVTGVFYVYEDENLAKKHVNPTIFSRLEKTKAKQQEAEAKEGEGSETKEGTEVEANTEEKNEEKSE